MLKRINWRIVFNCFLWVVCLGGLVVLMSFISVKKQEVKVTAVKIFIPGANNFIEREEIDAILKQGYGELVGRNLEEVNIHAIEERIKANPYIAFVKVYNDMDGTIKISVKQRQPVLRVINAAEQDFYVDKDGLKMPISGNFTANVLVATGNITEAFTGKIEKISTGMLSDLYKAALYIKQDTLWDAQIEQVYVNEHNDIELIPRVGIQRIILGNADMLETKMNNLLIFYKKAMPKVGWEAYKTINLKYVNQIVCEKNKIDSNARRVAALPDSTQVNRQAQDSLMNSVMADELKTLNKEEPKQVVTLKSSENGKKPQNAAPTKKNAPAPAQKSDSKQGTQKTTLPDKTKTSNKTQQNK